MADITEHTLSMYEYFIEWKLPIRSFWKYTFGSTLDLVLRNAQKVFILYLYIPQFISPADYVS